MRRGLSVIAAALALGSVLVANVADAAKPFVPCKQSDLTGTWDIYIWAQQWCQIEISPRGAVRHKQCDPLRYTSNEMPQVVPMTLVGEIRISTTCYLSGYVTTPARAYNPERIVKRTYTLKRVVLDTGVDKRRWFGIAEFVFDAGNSSLPETAPIEGLYRTGGQ